MTSKHLSYLAALGHVVYALMQIKCKRPFDRTFKCVGEWAIV
jgi:hypothetical protein